MRIFVLGAGHMGSWLVEEFCLDHEVAVYDTDRRKLKYFFSEKIRSDSGDDVSNKTIKNLIKEIIEDEDPNKPLNDQKIAEMLKDKSFQVARRTVAKYREQMMIPVSRLRRKL